MKNKFKLLSLLLIANGVYAQQNPTNTNPGGAASGMQSQQYWSRAGNNNNNGANNIFGTLWNSPIYTVTNGVNRMKLNGSLNYSIDGYNIARSGYLLLGSGVAPSTGLFNNANLGAYSQLHLTGRNGTFVQTGGHRPWMQTGITFTL